MAVARDEPVRKAPFQLQRQRFSAHEAGIQHRVAHLGVVLERHLRNRFRIRPPDALEFRKQRLPVLTAASSIESNTTQSSNAAFIPWPWKGTMAWAASPSSSTCPPTRQGAACTVASCPAGCAWNSAARSGISGTASGNSLAGRIPGRPESQSMWRSCAAPARRGTASQ